MPAEFFVHNLGCKLNRVEADALGAALLTAGASPVTRDEAQVVIVNTCTVTAEAEAKTRKAIRQALASPAEPWVIATGCAIALDPEGCRALGARVIAEPDRLLAQARALELLGLAHPAPGSPAVPAAPGVPAACSRNPQPFAPPPSAAPGVPAAHPAPGTSAAPETPRVPYPSTHHPSAARSRSRLGIKIQDGCDGACSYCVVRVARGPARSVPLARVREQVCAAEREGFRELVLTGVNIGSYRDGDRGLTRLVEELLGATAEVRLRLSSLEPQHADDGLLELMAASEGRLCAHLHLPLQSGCDRVLEAMARPYGSAAFERLVISARRLMPRIALTTDVIVGFPGESDEDFEASRAFCERMGFALMHVFRYSARPQTPAAALPGRVPPRVCAARSKALRELAARMRRGDAEARVGSRERVLVERRGLGTSESYHRVAVPASARIGSLVSVRFTGYRDTLLQAVF